MTGRVKEEKMSEGDVKEFIHKADVLLKTLCVIVPTGICREINRAITQMAKLMEVYEHAHLPRDAVAVCEVCVCHTRS